MKVRFYPEVHRSYANILWQGLWPMKHGSFPSDHPVTEDAMATFGKRGYWVSCFPDGDGVVFSGEDGTKSNEEVIKDIEECFGFTITNKERER